MWLKSGFDVGGRRDRLRIYFTRPLGDVHGVNQSGHRHLAETRIAEVIGTVGKHAFLDFGEQVDIRRGVQFYAFEIGSAGFLDADQLRQRDPARAGQRRGVQRVAAPVDPHRFTPLGLVLVEVFLGNQAFVLLHLRDQQVGGFAVVELFGALIGDALQRLG